MPGELKLFGGVCQVEIILFEGGLNDFAFEPFERGIERFIRAGRGRPGLLQPGFGGEHWQTGRLDFMTCFQNQRAFHRVAELADVARPGMASQAMLGVGGELRHRAAGLLAEIVEEVLGQYWRAVGDTDAQMKLSYTREPEQQSLGVDE